MTAVCVRRGAIKLSDEVKTSVKNATRYNHRPRNPRMLAKKLETIVWNPKAVRVAPRITKRIMGL